jgi:pimeloyl-ACP methyl ester carboxylesterase
MAAANPELLPTVPHAATGTRQNAHALRPPNPTSFWCMEPGERRHTGGISFLSCIKRDTVSSQRNFLLHPCDDIDWTSKLIAVQDAPNLLVGHAYGCAVITGAGLMPNVVASSIRQDPVSIKEGASGASSRGEYHLRVWLISLRTSTGFCRWYLRSFTRYSVTISRTKMNRWWALTQKPTVSRCLEERSGPPAWRAKPSWYQISSNDRLIPPETERWMAVRINARRTVTVETSLASVATHPDEIVKLIEEASSSVAA